jgi:hypothetical protein
MDKQMDMQRATVDDAGVYHSLAFGREMEWRIHSYLYCNFEVGNFSENPLVYVYESFSQRQDLNHLQRNPFSVLIKGYIATSSVAAS